MTNSPSVMRVFRVSVEDAAAVFDDLDVALDFMKGALLSTPDCSRMTLETVDMTVAQYRDEVEAES